MARDREVEQRLREAGVDVVSCPGDLLFEPGTILNANGKPFQVFTAFWRACLSAPEQPKPGPAPDRFGAPAKWPDSLAIDDLGLEPEVDWAGGLRPATPCAWTAVRGRG